MPSLPSEDSPRVPAPPHAERQRVRALHASQLLDDGPEEAFDRLTRLARHLLGVPVSLVSLVDEERQLFKSQQGLPEPWCTTRETPLSHSFCQHVVARRAPLVVCDAREHPSLRDNLAIRDLDVVAYLGIPIHDPAGHAFGSLCAIDSQPREWTEEHVAVLTDLARAVENEIALRYELRGRLQAERDLAIVNEELAAFNASLEARVEKRTAALRARSEQVEALTRALTLAEQRERHRLAHVLHDDLQQLLFGIQLQVRHLAARGPLALEEADSNGTYLLEGIDRLLARALTLTRTLSHELAPPALDEDGLEIVLAWLAEQFGAVHGLHFEGPCPVPDRALRALLVQLVRELLFNVVKHAGVERASLRLRVRDDAVEIVVEDAGVGFELVATEASDTGFGVRSVRERIALIGGSLTLESAPGEGSRATLTVSNVSPDCPPN
jgi:signal transduction histidine kinase